jgi:hypothetical protein
VSGREVSVGAFAESVNPSEQTLNGVVA